MNSRKGIAAATLATLLASLLLISTVVGEEPPETTHDGLQLVKGKKLDLVYIRPGATLAAYTKVAIDPVNVAFASDWKPSNLNVNAKDRERIRTGLADEFFKVFTKELETEGGYQIVETAGPDVLRVTAVIADLYITAPDTQRAANTRSWVVSAGRMTLIAELRDSESGAVLARVADREGGRESDNMTWASSTSNRAEARRILGEWARVLRDALDSVRS